MDYYELKKWVSNYMRGGFSPNEIKEHLLSLNYPEEVIDRVIDECLSS